ncbi:MAG TPA: homoserine kinase [Motilibacteraceae bacterium]|nr:homoserine kinase [Motilibacteraceae bacterium]
MSAPSFHPGAVRVRVPATSANLGPGFDALGLAVGLHDEVVVQVTDGGLVVDVEGEGAADVPRDDTHLVVRALHAAFDAMGGRPAGVRMVCTNRIPHARGLGSSAAAVVAGIAAARALVADGARQLDDQAALELATAFEGHPDNVAACLLGGLTVAWTEQTEQTDHTEQVEQHSAGHGRARAVRLDPAAGLVAVALVPPTGVSTELARGLLPAQVPHADAALNAGRAALLVEALTRRPDLLLPATEDRLHQHQRGPAMPASLALVAALRADGLPAVVSGAGPTVLVLVAEHAAATVVARAGELDAAFRAHVLPLQSAGAEVEPVA